MFQTSIYFILLCLCTFWHAIPTSLFIFNELGCSQCRGNFSILALIGDVSPGAAGFPNLCSCTPYYTQLTLLVSGNCWIQDESYYITIASACRHLLTYKECKVDTGIIHVIKWTSPPPFVYEKEY